MFIDGLTTHFFPTKALKHQKRYLYRGLFNPKVPRCESSYDVLDQCWIALNYPPVWGQSGYAISWDLWSLGVSAPLLVAEADAHAVLRRYRKGPLQTIQRDLKSLGWEYTPKQKKPSSPVLDTKNPSQLTQEQCRPHNLQRRKEKK